MPNVDLDAAAAEIEARRQAWTQAGFGVGQLTWRDRARGWPWKLVAREDAAEPDSVGFRVTKGVAVGAVVLFNGGWADVDWWPGTAQHEPEVSAPNIDGVEAFSDLLDALFKSWRDRVGRADVSDQLPG
jgi:hypothetical protein